MSYIIDIEADNFLLEATKVWCAVLYDTVSKSTMKFTNIGEFVKKLNEADCQIVGHNIMMYDLPLLRRLYGLKYKVSKVYDTILVSRLLEPDRLGGHSLEAWGKRLGVAKGTHTDFSQYSPEMLDYCEQDVKVTLSIFERQSLELQNYPGIEKSIRLEHEFAYLINKQIEAGFTLDVEKAKLLAKELTTELSLLKQSLKEKMKPVPIMTHFKSCQAKGLLLSHNEEGYTYTCRNLVKVKKFEYDEPNPTSRQQIADYLIEKGWKPTVLTETGLPKIDETALSAIDIPEAKEIGRMFRVQKMLGMLQDGDNAWLKLVKPSGRVHGDVITNGANTGRCTHCVPMNTQALTKEGWKTYEELRIGEEILAYDMSRNLKVWTPLINKSKFVGRVVGSIKNKSMQFRCTENHRWVTKQKSKNRTYYRIKETKDLTKSDRLLINAPYEFGTLDNFQCVWDKYNTNYFPYITNYTQSLLGAFLNGFLLADGHFSKSANGKKHTWYFVQATGHIFDVMLTSSYLYSDKRISSYKHSPKTDRHRESNTCLFTSSDTFSVHSGLRWIPETIEDVWCPETKYGTWVMKQGNNVTITGNSKPNMSQVDKDKNMRGCWKAKDGWKLVGTDASGLELRILAHYLAPYDKGAFAHEVLNGDVHTYNQKNLRLDSRDDAKTFIYALIYGAGNIKLGYIKTKLRDDEINRRVGGRVRNNVADNFTGYVDLLEDVKKAFKLRGYLRGIDNRPLHPRQEYSALNLLIQSAGALVMKQAMINSFKLLLDKGIKLGVQYNYVGNIHDEIQIECDPNITEEVGKIVVDAIRKAGEDFQLKCKLDGEYKIGDTWAETH